MHYKVLQNDDELGQIQVTCTNTLSSHGFLRKYDGLEKQYDKLQMQHTQLRQQLFQQTLEYKNLQADFELSSKLAKQNETESYKLTNMEQIVDEVRNDNRKFMDRIEEQQAALFGKEREIDKLKHQVKHGVVAGGLSPTFDHSYAGPGGSIATGSLVSKVELAVEAQKLLSEAQGGQLKWR